MELFPKEFVPELNTKNLGNSASFLTTKQTTTSTKRFRENGILTINVAAKFCAWTEQPQMDLQFLVLD
jgi:glutathione peroxidase-family protein